MYNHVFGGSLNEPGCEALDSLYDYCLYADLDPTSSVEMPNYVPFLDTRAGRVDPLSIYELGEILNMVGCLDSGLL
jgi:hypothetical protein